MQQVSISSQSRKYPKHARSDNQSFLLGNNKPLKLKKLGSLRHLKLLSDHGNASSNKQIFPFLRQFLAHPGQVGSILPSSQNLANMMLSDLEFARFYKVMEFGPGTGAFSTAINKRLSSGTDFYAVEPNPTFQGIIRQQFPNIVIISDTADQLSKYFPAPATFDLVASGIPFSMLSSDMIEDTIAESYRVLKNGGHFRTFIYHHTFLLPKIREMLNQMQSCFRTVTIRPVYKNFPPAKVILCQK